MRTIRSLFTGLMFIGLSLLALPASAADKVFSFYVTVYNNNVAGGPLSTAPGTPSVVLLDTFNRTPTQFNSVIKSVQDSLPNGVVYKILADNTANGGSASCGAPPAAPTGLTPGDYLPGPITRNSLQGVKPNGHYCLWIAAYDTTPSTGACALESYSGQANTGANFGGGSPFTDFFNQTSVNSYAYLGSSACTGVLGCDSTNNKSGLDPSLDLAYADPNYQGKSGVLRGGNKILGQACVVVPFELKVDKDSVPQTAKFFVPPGTNQAVSAQWIVVWGKTKVVPYPYPSTQSLTDPNTGWTINRPKVAWVVDSGTGLPVYVPALACPKDPDNFALVQPSDFPAYQPIIPNSPPFNDPGQRTEYQPGQLAKMCVSQLGWTSIERDTNGDVWTQQWIKLLDFADGFVSFD